MHFKITGEQAEALREVLQDHADGGPVLFTTHGVGGDLTVAFSLATVEITAGGTVEEV